ncbi:MAG: manno-octulosonate cytidylyltransferase [Candidatus Aenigmatarchaeota archaeon]
MNNICIIIPARLGSTRLPGKMLMEVNGKPILYYTWKKAIESNIGDVFIAAADDEIVERMKIFGAKSYRIPNNLPSGTDAVYFCFEKYLRKKYEYIINLQGDTPNIPPYYIEKVIEPVRKYSFSIGTLCYKTTKNKEKEQIVKVVFSDFHENIKKALYFSRSPIPNGSNFYYHHVGIYSFTEDSLRKFCSLANNQGFLEKSERLEQLRALENDMTIGLVVVNEENVYGIDTPEDFEKFRNEIEKFQ